MTPKEFAHATMLVASLRTRLGHANALTAAVTTERDDLAKQLAAHVESLTLSNAQCAEYLRQNEQLHSLLQTVSAQRDDLQMAKDDITNELAETTKDLAYSRLAVDTMCARDKRFTSTAALCGAGANEDVGDFIERTAAERDKLRSELVEVRAALASATEQRDSLRRTLDEWERADTKPHTRIDEVAQVVPVCMQCLKERIKTAHDYETGPSVAILTKPLLPDDVADHVVPPVLHVGEPDPVNDPKDAALEFRNVVPTPEMLKHVGYWDLVSGAAAIAFKPGGLRLVFWRISGSQEWRTDPCPQPLKPHGMTWQQLDKVLATAPHDVADHVVPPVLPLCNVCHGCGGMLIVAANSVGCYNVGCRRTMTVPFREATVSPFHPYYGPCSMTGACSHG